MAGVKKKRVSSTSAASSRTFFYHWQRNCLLINSKPEIPATWYRTPKREFQKSAGGGAGKNGGAGQSAGTGAGRSGPLGKQRQNSLPAPVPALWPAPPFLPAPVPAPPPALFWNSLFGVLCQVAGISIQNTQSFFPWSF